MITGIIYFIIALMSLQWFSHDQPFPAHITIGGTVGILFLIGMIGYFRVRKLIRLLVEKFGKDDSRSLQMLDKWGAGFQFMTFASFFTILLVFRWGTFINSIFKSSRVILLDEILGLLPYFIALLIYWSLSCMLRNGISREQWTYRGYILFSFQMQLTPIAPIVLYMALADALEYLPYPWCMWIGNGTGPADFLLALIFISGIGIVFPLFLIRMWSCKPLEPGEKRYLLESVCKEKGLKFREIMVWDMGERKFLNAGVIGIISRFRYILLTGKLLEIMNDEELIGVVGHEIGHAKKHHILLNILISFGFISFFLLISQVLGLLLVKYFSFLGPAFLGLAYFALTAGVIVFYWRIVFGFILRRFERSADIYGAETAGSIEPMISALEKLAVVSGRPRHVPDWTHYSIAERVDFLRKTETDPSVKERFNIKTGRFIKGLVITAALMLTVSITFLFLNASVQSPPLERWFDLERYEAIEHYLVDQLEQESIHRIEKASYLNNLAWLYATSNDAHYLKPGLALEYSLEAVEIIESEFVNKRPSDPDAVDLTLATYIDTLAAAYYVKGNILKAVELSEKAVNLCPQGTSDYETLVKSLIKYRKALRDGDRYI